MASRGRLRPTTYRGRTSRRRQGPSGTRSWATCAPRRGSWRGRGRAWPPASSLIRPLPFGRPVRVAAVWVAREPEATVWRVVRGLAFVAAGVVVLVDGSAVLTLFLNVLGIYLIYEGVSMMLRVVYREEE